MTAAALFADLRVRGIHLELVGEQLRCRADAGVLTPALAVTIKTHKPALIALLREEEAAIAWRVAAMQTQIPPMGTGAVPFLVAKPDLPPAGGICVSCGEPFELMGYVPRCRLYTVAATRALAAVEEDIAQAAQLAAA